MGTKEKEECLQFHEMGLDDRILKAIAKLGWNSPTLIQEKAIPLILEGKDVLCRARTGSGKTGAFGIPLLQRLLTLKSSAPTQEIRAIVIAPSKELASQLHSVLSSLASSASRDLNIINIGAHGESRVVKGILGERPDVVVATPSSLLHHLQNNHLKLDKSLEILVVDEADLIFSFGYESDLKALLNYFPSSYQSILASATLSSDVINMKKLLLRSPVILKLQEPLIPSSLQLQHFVVRAEEEDKFVLIYALFKLSLVRGKSLIFVNTVDRSYKLKLYLEQFGIKSCVLNGELPTTSRWHTVQEFNTGKYNVIIASDDRHLDEKGVKEEEVKEEESGSTTNKLLKRDKESGVSRGIDFQFVSNVINFDFPLDSSAYLHRVGRTARGNNKGAALSFINIKEEPLLAEVESVLRELSGESELKMRGFNFRMDEVEGFRYRARDAWKAVTRIAIREARLKEIRIQMMNSQKLKSYFESNPSELNALRHDKALHIVKQQPHLKNVPDYILPKTLRGLGSGTAHSTAALCLGATGRSANKGKKGRKGKMSKSKYETLKKKKDPLKSMEFKGVNKKGKKRAKKNSDD